MSPILFPFPHGLVMSYPLTSFRVSQCTQNKVVPLHFAALYGYIDIVRVLLEKGANVNLADEVRIAM